MAICLAIFLIAFNLFIPPPAIAVDFEDIPPSVRQSVIRLSGNSGCATGFIVGNQIVTNAHVTEKLCPYGECDPITVKILDSVETESWKYLKNQEAVMVQEVPTLDVALLKIPSITQNSISQTSFSSAKIGGQVYILGFPSCGDITLTEGKILAKTPTGFRTSALTKKGSSGSPVFNQNFEIIGVAMQSSSLIGGIASLPFNTSTPTDFVDIGYTQTVLWSKDSELALIEMKILNSIYRDFVVSSKGLDRMRASFDFIMAADVVLRRSSFFLLDKGTLFALFAGRENSLNFLRHPFKPSSPELLEAEKLGTAFALEVYGLHDETFEEIDVPALLENLRDSGRSRHHAQSLEELISLAQVHKPANWIFSILLFFGFGLSLLAAWGWSLGYVFKAANGSWHLRILKMMVIGLMLWPLSLIAFWLMNKPQQIPEPTNSTNPSNQGIH